MMTRPAVLELIHRFTVALLDGFQGEQKFAVFARPVFETCSLLKKYSRFAQS
jgi:hypothetical protein